MRSAAAARATDASAEVPAASVRAPAADPLPLPATVLRLQRMAGNRSVLRLLQRREAAPDIDTVVQDALGARPAEEARIAAAIQAHADARRLLPGEIAEAAELPRLEAPANGPVSPGAQKILAGALRLPPGAQAGSPSEFVRAENPAGAMVAFVKGDPADPDAQIRVTPDGLLEVVITTRKPGRAVKGKPPPPPKVTYASKTYDLAGQEVKLSKKQTVSDLFTSQATESVTDAAQDEAITGLEASTARVSGGVGAVTMTVGELAALADPAVYVQTGYLDKAKTKESWLTAQVEAAFDRLHAEFDEFVAQRVDQCLPRDELVERFGHSFAEQLVPTQAAIDAAQIKLEEARAKHQAAEQALAAAEANLLASAAPAKGATKEQLAAAKKAKKERDAAQEALTKTAGVVKWREQGVRDASKFRDGIMWILDPSRSTEQLAASTVGSLCNVLSYYFYGRAIGVVTDDFSTYYFEQVRSGRITKDDDGGMYIGTGSSIWAQLSGLERENPGAQREIGKDKKGKPIYEDVPMSDPSRRAELEALLASDIRVAISHQDFNNTPAKKAHHFLLIVKDDRGLWRNLDHTSRKYQRRGGLTDWSRVFRVDSDAALIKAARASLDAAAAAKAAAAVGPAAPQLPAPGPVAAPR